MMVKQDDDIRTNRRQRQWLSARPPGRRSRLGWNRMVRRDVASPAHQCNARGSATLSQRQQRAIGKTSGDDPGICFSILGSLNALRHDRNDELRDE